MLDLKDAAALLEQRNRFCIAAHKSPDGDTVGSAFALFYALQGMGKQAMVVCHDPWPRKFDYCYPEHMPSFEPECVVAVDVADEKLLGTLSFAGIDLAIDHHAIRSLPAVHSCVDASRAATAEIVLELLHELNADITQKIADCLYTGICTDTGCFRYSNTTAQTHIAAAELMKAGARAEQINSELFEQKTRGRIALEQAVLNHMEFLMDGRCTYVLITQEMMQQAGAVRSDYDGIPALLRCPVGVQIGITVKETEDGAYKASVRTSSEVDAAEFCRAFGGGGHSRAAGCSFSEEAAQVRRRLLEHVKGMIEQR